MSIDKKTLVRAACGNKNPNPCFLIHRVILSRLERVVSCQHRSNQAVIGRKLVIYLEKLALPEVHIERNVFIVG